MSTTSFFSPFSRSVPLANISTPSTEGPIVRSSPEAIFGKKRIGTVTLPRPLIQGIADLVEGIKKSSFLNT